MTTGDAHVELKAYQRPTIRRNRAGIVAIAVVFVVLAFAVPLLTTAMAGDTWYAKLFRGYPGSLTAMLASGLRTAVDLAGWVTTGSLVALMFVLGRPGRRRLDVDTEPEWRIARIASLTWAILAAVMIGVDAADANGASLSQLFIPGGLAYLIQATYLPAAWIVVFLLMTTVTICIQFAQRWTGLLVPLALSALSLLAPVVVGQVLVGPDHDYGSDAATFQTLAAAALFGTIVVLALRVAGGRLLRPVTLRRTWLVSAGSWTIIVLSDVVITLFKLAGPGGTNPTALLIGLRALVLIAVGAVLVVLWLRRNALTDRTIRVALTLGVVSAAGYAGLTAAMLRVPPPVYFTPTSIEQLYFGYDLPGAPTFAALAVQWRPNILFLGIAVAAVAVYLFAVARLRRRGDAWPAGRTAAWVLGWVIVVIATSSGVGKYAGASFAVHMAAHMTLNMLAPVFLVLGGVITLMLRATRPAARGEAAGPHEWITAVLHWDGLRLVFHPLRVFVVYIATYYVLYFSPLFETFIRYHWAHRLMDVEFLAIGYLFFALIIGVDRPPRPLPPIGKLGFTLAAMPFHAFFGVILMTAAVPVAANFYKTVDPTWMGDLMSTQYVGGGIAWAGGEIPLLIVVVALGIQWARQDQREARRKDRHMDTGLDDDFEAYNRMLRELEERSHGRQPTAVTTPATSPSEESQP
ncbi:cytochrome c oxidase assembly protein [Microbacterium sp.]|uniref:cytochrome c oxidase assembly protein n=1 Tax=Microbacterium sp. TaxID=51671 RepID=UPI00092B728E|nr:cytochrome c oxidase assembly protein [Microbacterium sp.]MBN9188465.1 cytochrome c oxidase assembly protein [Microbacterium sp.]MBN9194081.1 cytochrome c oxidase assembly protein [Microbacterium sp.]OJU59886.1 MAG: hypothetical protein BGO04_03535 [Microbacterium sp. 70-38]